MIFIPHNKSKSLGYQTTLNSPEKAFQQKLHCASRSERSGREAVAMHHTWKRKLGNQKKTFSFNFLQLVKILLCSHMSRAPIKYVWTAWKVLVSWERRLWHLKTEEPPVWRSRRGYSLLTSLRASNAINIGTQLSAIFLEARTTLLQSDFVHSKQTVKSYDSVVILGD